MSFLRACRGSMDFPIVDFSRTKDPSTKLAAAKQLTLAIRSLDDMLLKNYGVPVEQIEAMFTAANNFFRLTSDMQDYRSLAHQQRLDRVPSPRKHSQTLALPQARRPQSP